MCDCMGVPVSEYACVYPKTHLDFGSEKDEGIHGKNKHQLPAEEIWKIWSKSGTPDFIWTSDVLFLNWGGRKAMLCYTAF